MKKLYYLADVLTCSEVIAGIILLAMTALHISADVAIWVFVLGELCDAFDGPAARRWPYPNDGKKRWWRTYVKEIEHGSDIFIAISCMAYLMSQPYEITFTLPPLFTNGFPVAEGAKLLGMFIIIICSLVEVEVQSIKAIFGENSHHFIKPIILARRWVYAFVGIGGGIFLLLMATSWPQAIKQGLILLGILVGIALLYYKLDRAGNI